MTTSLNPYLLTVSLIAWFVTGTHALAQVESRLSSRFLARGEQALLEIAVVGNRPDSLPKIPEVEHLEIRPSGRGPQSRLLPGRRIEHVFEYLVSSYQIGNHQIPACEMVIDGTASRSEPISFSVFNPDELQWSEAVAGSTRFRYASAFRALNTRPFEGENTAVEIKLYVPRDLVVEDWGIPDFQRDGLTAWRFQPSGMRGQLNLLGSPHVAVTYPSSFTPTRTGTIGIGPATLRLITIDVVMDGFLRRVAREVQLSVPGLEIESQPLPEGAPEGFENAVGNFTVTTRAETTTLQEGDPVPVEIVVRGTGNLDNLRPPRPVDVNGWRVYEATAQPRGEERRETSGVVVFRQFLRPLELKTALPAFELQFFDPVARTFRSASSDPIPLRMTPAPPNTGTSIAPPSSLETPVERMTDILGLLEPSTLTIPPTKWQSGWLLHLVGGVAATLLLLRIFWLRFGHNLLGTPEKTARRAAMRELDALAKISDDITFLRAAGSFIERREATPSSPAMSEIMTLRDSQCFRSSVPLPPELTRQKRTQILQTLRQLVGIVAMAFIMLASSSSLRASTTATDEAKTAYESAQYDVAIAKWLSLGDHKSLAPDILYNIGNAYYRAGSPGHAALYYRRAIARDPSHAESRQNLRFIERKHGAITIHRPEFQYALAKVPLDTWKKIVWAGAWLCLLGILVFPATQPKARVRLLAIIVLTISPLVLAAGALGWRYFPNDAEFAPLTRQAVITAPKAVLHTEASRTSPEVIDAPPGSLCEIIQISGRWAYVAFTNKTRGWIPMDSIEEVLPQSPPTAPVIKKSRADESNA